MPVLRFFKETICPIFGTLELTTNKSFNITKIFKIPQNIKACWFIWFSVKAQILLVIFFHNVGLPKEKSCFEPQSSTRSCTTTGSSRAQGTAAVGWKVCLTQRYTVYLASPTVTTGCRPVTHPPNLPLWGAVFSRARPPPPPPSPLPSSLGSEGLFSAEPWESCSLWILKASRTVACSGFSGFQISYCSDILHKHLILFYTFPSRQRFKRIIVSKLTIRNWTDSVTIVADFPLINLLLLD